MTSPPAVEDQARLLEDAMGMVRQQTHLMRKCLETPGKLMDALKCRYFSSLNISTSLERSCAADLKINAPAPHLFLSLEPAA